MNAAPAWPCPFTSSHCSLLIIVSLMSRNTRSKKIAENSNAQAKEDAKKLMYKERGQKAAATRKANAMAKTQPVKLWRTDSQPLAPAVAEPQGQAEMHDVGQVKPTNSSMVEDEATRKRALSSVVTAQQGKRLKSDRDKLVEEANKSDEKGNQKRRHGPARILSDSELDAPPVESSRKSSQLKKGGSDKSGKDVLDVDEGSFNEEGEDAEVGFVGSENEEERDAREAEIPEQADDWLYESGVKPSKRQEKLDFERPYFPQTNPRTTTPASKLPLPVRIGSKSTPRQTPATPSAKPPRHRRNRSSVDVKVHPVTIPVASRHTPSIASKSSTHPPPDSCPRQTARGTSVAQLDDVSDVDDNKGLGFTLKCPSFLETEMSCDEDVKIGIMAAVNSSVPNYADLKLGETGKINLGQQSEEVQDVMRRSIPRLLLEACFENTFPIKKELTNLTTDILLHVAHEIGYTEIVNRLNQRAESAEVKKYRRRFASVPESRFTLARGDLKDTASKCVASYHALPSDRDSCEKRVETLKARSPQYPFIFPEGRNGKGLLRDKPFLHPMIIYVLREGFFGDDSIVANFPGAFIPKKGADPEVPPPMLALVATAVFAALDEWTSGTHTTIKFEANKYASIYQDHIHTRSDLEELPATAGTYHPLMAKIFADAQCGCRPVARVRPASEMIQHINLEDDSDEE
ncbi:hypothetical protein JAAARDRAFT_51553 [Jaapia argillacea MUCL 33604]|uniref:DUF6532 domain-containing protein n=1 Tax=Jaapia argillacea MUCL 33604 TaxID=933084 RepID=A0A067P4N5_9AGAM|nr:hypothetical protein JAAARDRAFT_51553 [Jaapia argillacea MUCL 33604]